MHGYQGSGGRRDLLYTDVVTNGRKILWNSETGDSDGTGTGTGTGTGMTMAGNLLSGPKGRTGRAGRAAVTR